MVFSSNTRHQTLWFSYYLTKITSGLYNGLCPLSLFRHLLFDNGKHQNSSRLKKYLQKRTDIGGKNYLNNLIMLLMFYELNVIFLCECYDIGFGIPNLERPQHSLNTNSLNYMLYILNKSVETLRVPSIHDYKCHDLKER